MKKALIALIVIVGLGIATSVLARAMLKWEMERQQRDVHAVVSVGMASKDAHAALQHLGTPFGSETIPELRFREPPGSTNLTYYGYRLLMIRLEHADDKVRRVVMEKLEYK